mmetsp:Transcript_14868/g.29202  ORF Transcript_14868/g.29202 Transcript_14868/m.29202 type:complete len:118 (+) Transcript_14868:288-641(+)
MEIVTQDNFLSLAALANKYDVAGLPQIIQQRALALLRAPCSHRRNHLTDGSLLTFFNAIVDLGMEDAPLPDCLEMSGFQVSPRAGRRNRQADSGRGSIEQEGVRGHRTRTSPTLSRA